MLTGNLHFGKLKTAKRLTAVCAFSVIASLFPTHANASWFNDMFVYRKEQKPLIDPSAVNMPPIEVMAPYYSQRDAAEWSHHHTKANMKPVPYIDGSSSLVMRQQAKPRDNRRMKAWPGNLKANPNMKNLPQGYEAILWRDYVNRLETTRKKTFIGEPGFASKLPNNRTASVGQKTQIGTPVRSWKDAPAKNNGITARAGDYNYGQQTKNHYTAPYTTIDKPVAPSQPTMPQHNNHGTAGKTSGLYQGNLPSNYIVENGDSLSGISEKDKIYGNWKMWPLIYDANRNQIKDPDLIYPEQNLGIPRDYTQQDNANAQQRAMDKQPPYSFYDGR
jgi:nucleoid-associated protein YgaU